MRTRARASHPSGSGAEAQGIVQQRLGGRVVEALGRPGRRVPQRPGGLREVTPQPRMVGHRHRVGGRPPGQDPAGLPMQQRGPSRGRARGQCVPDQLMPEPERPVLLDQELPGGGPLGVVQQRDHGTAEHGREQLNVQLRADHGRGAQQ